MPRYEIILYWSNEDQAFVAEAPELPGCMAHGDDQETALLNIRDAMQFWIDRAQELGRQVPEPSGERLIRPDCTMEERRPSSGPTGYRH